MKHNLCKIIFCVCVVSLCLNFLFIGSIISAKEQYDPYQDWTDYVVTLRMDKQSDIFYTYAAYLESLRNHTASLDELSGYARAVFEFSNPEIVQGALNLQANQNEQMKKLLQEISYAGCLYPALEKIAALEDQEIVQLQNLYLDLSDLLNRNNTSASLAYYIFLDDFESDESLALQNQTRERISQIHTLLEQ